MHRPAYILDRIPECPRAHVFGELAELNRRGIDISICALEPPRNGTNPQFSAAGECRSIVCHQLSSVPAMMREFRPSLFHAHGTAGSTSSAREFSVRYDLPFTLGLRWHDVSYKLPPNFCQISAAAAAVITDAQATADYLRGTFGLPCSRMHILRPAVDTNVFRPVGGDIVSSEPYILCVARQTEARNLRLLLQACALLRDRGTRFRCVMLGNGPLHAELRAWRASLQLQSVLGMPGAVEKAALAKWWQQADVGVLTSQIEGTPMCLLEAAACGVPVVAVVGPGVADIVKNGVTGLLVPPGDPKELSFALELLLTDAKLRRRMGQAARERAVQEFSLAKRVEGLLGVWATMLPGATV